MKKLRNNPVKKSTKKVTGFIMIVLGSLFLLSCQKQAESPLAHAYDGRISNISNTVTLPDFKVSASKVVLLQDNASVRAVSLNWANAGSDATYTVEAALGGSSFEEPVELGATDQLCIGFTVKDFNAQISKLLYVNNTGNIELRVRAQRNGNTKPVYSSPVALEVTTYRVYTDYDDSKMFRIPGNHQNWVLATAPKIVTQGNGGYEGYINFTNDHPQFLMVRGEKYTTNNTFQFIGNYKFGYNGSMMPVYGGRGVYLLKASTNTNTWWYTKINSWALNGTAVPNTGKEDPAMTQNGTEVKWSINVQLVKGNFRFRANNCNTITLGQNPTDMNGVPSYDGNNIEIKKDGNYTITLELGLAGNYAYSILKNNNN